MMMTFNSQEPYPPAKVLVVGAGVATSLITIATAKRMGAIVFANRC